MSTSGAHCYKERQ